MEVVISIFSLLLEAMMDSLFFFLLKVMVVIVIIKEFKFIILIDFKDCVCDL